MEQPKDLAPYINYDKKPVFNTGEYDKSTKREKGMFIVKFDSIPEGYTITVYSGDFFRKFTSFRTENFGFPGGIYNVKYSNNNCKSVSLKEYSFYLPTYSGDKDGKVWDDATIYTPPKEEKKFKSTIVLIIILIIILVALGFVVIIIKKRNRGVGDNYENKM